MRTAYLSATSNSSESATSSSYTIPSHRWIDFLLLGFMLSILALSLDAAGWSPGLDRLVSITVMAVIAATLISLTDFSPLFALLYSIVTGAAAILFGLSSLATGTANHWEEVYQVIQRTFIWFNDVLSGNPGADTLVFVLLLAILLWILSFNAVWVYFREGRKWQAVLPTGLAMLVNLYYAPVDLKAYFILYLIAAMLLLVRATLAEREAQWYRERIYFPFDIGFDVMRDGVIFILFVVLVSWVLPSTLTENDKEMINPLQDPWNQVKEEWTRLFNTLNYGESGGTVPASVVFTPSHPLEGARTLTNAPVMVVKTSVNRYFQATILDTYTSNAWELRNTININLETSPVPVPTFAARRTITQTVTMLQRTNILMGAPMPVSVSVPASARVIPQGLLPEEALTAETIGTSELAMLISKDIIQPGDAYTITSSISFATESQLRSDRAFYPPDIRARYLQLPDSVPQRVFDLAEEIAQGYDNPYDIARAIEAYVRSYEYSDQIPGPKPGQDAVDYFLFEEKKGYCDYYATAMAVMLRHLGIPTRLAQGYATGEYDPLSGGYRLLEKDAHTWVEVYFPTYGWIPFEPTSSEPVIERLSDQVIPPAPGGRSSIADQREEEQKENIPIDEDVPEARPAVHIEQGMAERIMSNLGFLFIALALMGVVLAGYYIRRLVTVPTQPAKTRIRQSPQEFMDRLWNRLLWWGRLLGVPERPSLTPFEQAFYFARILPQTAEDVTRLAQLYARDKYAPQPLNQDDLTLANYTWLRLRSQFIRAWLDKRFRFRHQITFWQ